MAGLIFKKIRDAFLSAVDPAPIDSKSMRSFYAASDQLVDQQFEAVLQDDLAVLQERPTAGDQDWGW